MGPVYTLIREGRSRARDKDVSDEHDGWSAGECATRKLNDKQKVRQGRGLLRSFSPSI